MSILFLGKAKNEARVKALLKRAGNLSAIHIHGWKWAVLVWLIRLCFPGRPIVWTCEGLPPRWVTRQAVWAGVDIVATTRELQWKILNEISVRVRYIPDGYDIPALPPISPRRFGLWPNRYTISIAPVNVKIKKKLIIVNEPSGSRAERSLFAGSAGIILNGENMESSTILAAMESGKPIISVTSPICEELLGVTAQFVSDTAEEELSPAIKNLKPSSAAKTRARAHFTWDRIFSEYMPLYQPVIYSIPLDSARGILKAASGWRNWQPH